MITKPLTCKRSKNIDSIHEPSLLHSQIDTQEIPPPPQFMPTQINPKLRNVIPHNITHSLVSQNPRERMFVVQIWLFIVTFLFLISWILSSMQTTKEADPHPRFAPCVNMWSIPFLFFFICHLLNVGACIPTSPGKATWSRPHQRRWENNEFKFHRVTWYTNSIVCCIHVNTTKLRNITCTLVATCVILRSLECIFYLL